MSGGVSAGTIASYAAAASAVVGAASSVYQMAQGKPKAPEAPKLPDAPVAQQGEKTPDAGVIKKNTAAMFGGAGQSSTMLTGLDGVAPAGLSLAKNTLLGA